MLGTVVLGMLALDLFVFHRKAHEVSLRGAAAWSVVSITLGLAVNRILLVFVIAVVVVSMTLGSVL